VEIIKDCEWGTVCNDGDFQNGVKNGESHAGKFICNEHSFPYFVQYWANDQITGDTNYKPNEFGDGHEEVPVHFDDLICKDAATLSECTSATDEDKDCGVTENVAIECSDTLCQKLEYQTPGQNCIKEVDCFRCGMSCEDLCDFVRETHEDDTIVFRDMCGNLDFTLLKDCRPDWNPEDDGGTIPRAVCKPVAPSDGTKGDCGDRLDNGQSCTPKCNAGYSLNHNTTCELRVLVAGTCEPNECDPTEVAHSVNYSDMGSLKGSTDQHIPVNCLPGYTTNNAVAVCNKNGAFSTVTCSPIECNDKVVANSGQTLSGTTGATDTITCNANYSGGGEWQCQPNGAAKGTWTGPGCIANNCSACVNGTPARGDQCEEEGGTTCKECDLNYKLEGGACSCDLEQYDIRLSGEGHTNRKGRVEIVKDCEWGTVCNDGDFQKGDGKTGAGKLMCKMLGFPFFVRYWANDQHLGSTTNYKPHDFGDGHEEVPVHFDDLDCQGAANLSDCTRATDEEKDCKVSENVAIECSVCDPDEYFETPEGNCLKEKECKDECDMNCARLCSFQDCREFRDLCPKNFGADCNPCW